ncbi:MAG TPA: hypothetical protein VGU74_11285 [Gemmatimonadales bacterium]|nr:hypothetical protein [Gemmatimonadales bacterium]
MPNQKITPFLWFDNQAEEGAVLHLDLQKLQDPRKANRVMQVLLKMKKLDIAKLTAAAEG